MSAEVELGLLGTLSLTVSSRPVAVPVGRQQVALAALALDAGRTVNGDALVEYLWDAAPPAHPRQALHTTMARLRKLVGTDRLVSHGGGYLLNVPRAAVDVHRFRAGVAAARAADPGHERAPLTEALGLWRGPALDGVDSDTLRAIHVHPLTEQWFTASEWLLELRLEAGEAADVVGDIRSLIATHPLRESLWCLLMSALAATGRQAEALAAYQDIRRQLRDELGVDPGASLVAQQAAVLGGSAAVTKRSAAQVAPPQVPRQVPAPPMTFTGRAEELDALDRVAAQWRSRPGRMAIAVVDGAGGMGKTALATEWAHQAADQFPDGQLFLNLRGYGPGEPAAASWAAGTLLSAFGVADQQIPTEEEARLALLRTTLTGKRLLVVLDNARDVDHVRPLLPGTDAFVLVTSRNQLRGLVSREGARRVTLGALTEAESESMLNSVAAGARPEAARELARLCGHVPLALAVAGERLGRAATSGTGRLLDQLRDEQRRLDALTSGDDDATDVRAVLSWSYRAADEEAHLFRMLAVAPGPDISVAGAAVLSGTSVDEAAKLLDRLSAAHLAEETAGRRFELHDLIRVYAAELAWSEDSQEQAATARERLLRWYQATAVAARSHLTSNQPLAADAELHPEPLELADRSAALRWFEEERMNLVAAVWAAAADGLDRCAWQLAAALNRFLIGRRPWDHQIPLFECALACARRDGDRYGEALLLACLGDSHHFVQRYAESVAFSRRALDVYRDLEDDRGQVGMLTNIGMSLSEAGMAESAIEHHRRAVEACRALRDPTAEALVWANLAAAYVGDERYADGAEAAQRALASARAGGDPLVEADARDELGTSLSGLGSHDGAIDHFHAALAVYRSVGHPHEIPTLDHLARTHLAAGDPGRARETWRRAVARALELGDPAAGRLRAELGSLR